MCKYMDIDKIITFLISQFFLYSNDFYLIPLASVISFIEVFEGIQFNFYLFLSGSRFKKSQVLYQVSCLGGRRFYDLHQSTKV